MSNRLGFKAYLSQHLTILRYYFQPPANKKMEYPCLIYRLTGAKLGAADNMPYKITPSYQLILVDRDPDSKYLYELMRLPRCRFDRFYTADNLNHWVFQAHYTGIFPDAKI